MCYLWHWMHVICNNYTSLQATHSLEGTSKQENKNRNLRNCDNLSVAETDYSYSYLNSYLTLVSSLQRWTCMRCRIYSHMKNLLKQYAYKGAHQGWWNQFHFFTHGILTSESQCCQCTEKWLWYFLTNLCYSCESHLSKRKLTGRRKCLVRQEKVLSIHRYV
jgi:hypothetical protein